MSLFETKTADNFIFDEAFEPREQDSLNTPFYRKNVSYVIDQQAGNGSYANGQVIIDSQAIASSGNFIDWRNAYLTVPKQVLVQVKTNTALTLSYNNTNTARLAVPKNNAQIATLKVEANGKTIITSTVGLADLVNLKTLATNNKSSLEKIRANELFYPDSSESCAATKASINNYDKETAGTGLCNFGLVERQRDFVPVIQTSFMSSTNNANEGRTNVILTNTTSATTSYADVVDFHYIHVIKLSKLADFFDKHPISRGVSYRFTILFNQATSEVPLTDSATHYNIVGTEVRTQISGDSIPSTLCVGLSNNVDITTTTGNTVTLKLTDQIDTSANKLMSGIRLYCPSYEMNPEYQDKLLKQPPIKKNFMDFLQQQTQTYVGANSFVNVQVSTSCTNPRALIVVPRWSTTATGNGGQGFYSNASALATVPGATDALLSLTNMQVKMGANYVLPDRLFYSFQTFLDHINSVFAYNGGESIVGSGLITKKMFETNHRYFVFDLSRYPEAMKDLPQMISFEATNNTAVSVELSCYLLYGREAVFDLNAGSLSLTA